MIFNKGENTKKKLEKKKAIYYCISSEILLMTTDSVGKYDSSSKVYVIVISYFVPIVFLAVAVFCLIKTFKIQKEINSLKNEDAGIEETKTDKKKSYKKTVLEGLAVIIVMFSVAILWWYLYDLFMSSIA